MRCGASASLVALGRTEKQTFKRNTTIASSIGATVEKLTVTKACSHLAAG
jgi:hypothetical protein